MSYTMEDFRRDYLKEEFPRLTPEERRELLHSLSPAARREALQALLQGGPLPGLSEEQARQLLEQLTSGRAPKPRKSRRKK